MQVIGPQFGTREMEISSTDGCHVGMSRDQPVLNRGVVHHDYSTVSNDLQTFHLSGLPEDIRQDYYTDLQSFHSSIPVDSMSRDSHRLFPTDIQHIGEHRTDVVTDSVSCIKIHYTTDFMRQIKQTMNSVTLSQDGKDRLRALGILRRFHRGRRGGI